MVSDGMLSQDEIDALLRGSEDNDSDFLSEDEPVVEDYLSSMEQDALGEIGNISFGSSATALSTLLNQKVDITTPTVSIIHKQKLAEEFPHPYVAIHVSYTEGFSGTNMLVIKQSDAAIIADLMLGGDGTNPSEMLGEIQLSAVQEAMNQMMGSAATSMSTVFSKKVDISPPSIDLLDIKENEGTERIMDDIFARISFRLKIGELIDSSIMQLLPIQFAKDLVNELMNPSPQPSAQSGPADSMPEPAPKYEEPAVKQPQPSSQTPMQPQYANGQGQGYGYENVQGYGQMPPAPGYGYGQPNMGYAPQPQPQHLGNGYGLPQGQPANIQPAVFSSFEPMQLPESESRNLNMLMDIPLQVTVELGRTKRSVKEILELSAGSIIELDKLAGEPVDILVNNKLVAKGEVVVIDENFGVRVTDIISPSDRIRNLQ